MARLAVAFAVLLGHVMLHMQGMACSTVGLFNLP